MFFSIFATYLQCYEADNENKSMCFCVFLLVFDCFIRDCTIDYNFHLIFIAFQGDLVQLKEMPTGASNELKSKAMDHLVMAHGLRHENINPLIGKY